MTRWLVVLVLLLAVVHPAAAKRWTEPPASAPGAASTCTDGVRNGKESDVDCGGRSCPPCANGALCGDHTDCKSRRCESSSNCSTDQDCVDSLLGPRCTDAYHICVCTTDKDCKTPPFTVCGGCESEVSRICHKPVPDPCNYPEEAAPQPDEWRWCAEPTPVAQLIQERDQRERAAKREASVERLRRIFQIIFWLLSPVAVVFAILTRRPAGTSVLLSLVGLLMLGLMFSFRLAGAIFLVVACAAAGVVAGIRARAATPRAGNLWIVGVVIGLLILGVAVLALVGAYIISGVVAGGS